MTFLLIQRTQRGLVSKVLNYEFELKSLSYKYHCERYDYHLYLQTVGLL